MRLVLLTALIALTACHSGWEKDPFANEAENVQKAVPPGTQKINIPPVRDVMLIDVDDTYVLKEGQKRIIPVNFRLLHPEFKFLKVEISNLESELPGATFDTSTHELVFEPEHGYVPTGAIVFSSVLRISLFAEYQGLQQEVRKELVFHVLRVNAGEPTIEEVNGLKESLFEGEKNTFEILVRDDISPSGPLLVIKNAGNSTVKGAQFISYSGRGTRVSGEPDLWRYKPTVDLAGLSDITPKKDDFRFEIQAFSALGVPASPRTRYFTVYTKANTPTFFMERKLEFKTGEKNFYSFSVVDTKKEGKVLAQFLDDCSTVLGTDASCRCEPANSLSGGGALCSIQWTPTEAGTFRLKLNAVNTVNGENKAKDEATSQAQLEINVVESGEVQ